MHIRTVCPGVLMVVFLMFVSLGCTAHITPGEQMIQEGQVLSGMGEKWLAGQKIQAKGQRLIKQGEEKIQEGQKKIKDGEDNVKKGQRLVEQGTQMVQESETARKAFPQN